MKGWEREDEQSTTGAEKRGCQGGAWGGMMWSKPLASTTVFAAALWIQTSRSRNPLQGVDIGWEVGIHGEMMMSPQITNRQAGRRQFYLQTNFLTIISSLAPQLVSGASVGPCLLSVSPGWAWLPAPSLDVPYALWSERNFQN